MSMVSVVQTGIDGIGQTKTLTGMSSIRLKAKDVSVTRETTLKITGNTTGTTYTLQVVVESGTPVGTFSPPPVTPPTGPIAGFTFFVSNTG